MTTTRARFGKRRRGLAAALGIVLSGCSFTSVQRPPRTVEDPRVADPCTTSVQAPIADTVLAGAALVGAYVALVVSMVDRVNTCSGQTGSCSTHVDVAPALALVGAGALFGSSAIYGFVGTHQCKRRTSLAGRCAYGDAGACRLLKPGWVPPPGLFPAPSAVPPGAAPPASSPPAPAWPPAPAPPPPAADGERWIDVPPAQQPGPPAPDGQAAPTPR